MGPRIKKWSSEMDRELFQMLTVEGRSYDYAARYLTAHYDVEINRNSVAGQAFRRGFKVKNGRRRNPPVRLKAITLSIPVPKPKPKPKPKPRPKSRYRGKPIDIMKLESGNCHFPFGGPGKYKYCGKPALIDKPYCAEHTKLCIRPEHR